MFALVSPAMFFAYVIGRMLVGAFVLLIAAALFLISRILWVVDFGHRHAKAWLLRRRQRRALGVR